MSNDDWRPVVGFDGLYRVSNSGVIFSVSRVVVGKKKQTVSGRAIRQQDNGNGYKTVRLWRDGKEYNRYVHRLVLESFAGPSCGLDCCHNDGDRNNNELSNLRWDTRSNNHMDKLSHGTMANGEKARAAKLTVEDVLLIRARIASGEEQKAIANDFGIKQPSVSDIATRRTWKHI